MSSTVLFVDDDPNILAGFQRAFRKQPFAVVTAEGPIAGLRVLESQPIDVVVSDQNMPEMTGNEFLAQIRVRYPRVIRIMLTGSASIDVAIRAINVGEIFRFLRKPCDPSELAAAIQTGLQHQELERQSRRMLKTVRTQRAFIEQLEDENPGIMHVKRNVDGAVVLDDESAEDISGLLRDLAEENDRAPRPGATPDPARSS